MDWRTAYFAQAKSDFTVFGQMRDREDIPLCHKLHYLQMATEKFAKGFLTPIGGGPYERTHDAFQKFVLIARQQPSIRVICGFPSASQFRAYVGSLSAIAGQIENLSPEGTDHPNPEYPWLDDNGDIISPLEYSFSSLDLKNPKMIKMMQFIENCFLIAG